MDGPSPQPALKRALLPRVIKKKSYNQRGGGGGQSVPFIHNIVNIHSLYYMCFSLVFACLSVSPSRGWISGASPRYPHPYLPAHTGNSRERHGPQVQKEQAGRTAPLWLRSPIGVFGCVCACMYREPVCNYVQREGVHCHRGWGRWGCSRPGRPGRLAHK